MLNKIAQKIKCPKIYHSIKIGHDTPLTGAAKNNLKSKKLFDHSSEIARTDYIKM